MAGPYQVHFVRIDAHQIEGAPFQEPLRVSNAPGSVFPLDTTYGAYVAVGDALRIEGVEASNDLSSREFTVSLVGVSLDAIDFLKDTRLTDNDVAVHRTDGVVEGGTVLWPEPELVVLGRVSNVVMNGSTVQATCYTASGDLGRFTGTATHWTDSQQRRFINPGDYGFRWSNRYWNAGDIRTT